MTEKLPIANDDINELRNALRFSAEDGGFNDYETTKLSTAASERARNILEYAGKNCVRLDVPSEGPSGIRMVFEDDGPGIQELERAMEDGFSAPESRGLGVWSTRGLSGHRNALGFFLSDSAGMGRLVEFETIRRWRSHASLECLLKHRSEGE